MTPEQEKISPKESPSLFPTPRVLIGGEKSQNSLRWTLEQALKQIAQEEEEIRKELSQRLGKTLGTRHGGRFRGEAEKRQIRESYAREIRKEPSSLGKVKPIIDSFLRNPEVLSLTPIPEEVIFGTKRFWLFICNRPPEKALDLLGNPHLQTLWEYFYARFILMERVNQRQLESDEAFDRIFKFGANFEFPSEAQPFIKEITQNFSFSRNSKH